jgi:hypothetical protein
VAVAEDQPVALGPLAGCLRIVFEDLKVERGKNIRHAERPRGVARARRDEHLDNRLADSASLVLN